MGHFLALLQNPAWGPLAVWAVVIAATLVAAISDARSRLIPNKLTFPLVLAGLAVSTISGGGEGLQSALWGMAVLGVPFIVLFVIAGGGAGDAKLMGAIGAWVGLPQCVPVLVGVTLAGGAMAIGYAVMRRRLRGVAGNLKSMAVGAGLVAFCGGRLSDAQAILPQKDDMLTMPYGISIFVGTLGACGWVLLWK